LLAFTRRKQPAARLEMNMGENEQVKPEVVKVVGEVVKDEAPLEVRKPAKQQSLFSEFFLFLKEEKKWWLGPLVVVLLLLATVIVFAEGSAIAPFIYSIF
jgi:hypothetical protein